LAVEDADGSMLAGFVVVDCGSAVAELLSWVQKWIVELLVLVFVQKYYHKVCFDILREFPSWVLLEAQCCRTCLHQTLEGRYHPPF